MRLRGDLGELCYCSNIHAGETWDEVRAAIVEHLPRVKDAACPRAPFGLGLRLSAVAADALTAAPARAELRTILDDHGLYVFTVNGFPHGSFHGTRVKENVYLPDWRTEERLAYTNRLADLLADIGSGDGPLSLSTVPGAFKPRGVGFEAEMADRLLRQAAHDVALAGTTGKTVALALEPEPNCFLETVEEAIAFFDRYLFSEAAVARLAGLAGLSRAAAAEALPRHLGLCYDVCHAAVEFEDPAGSVAALRRAGIPIHKLQLSAALRAERLDADARAALSAFDETTYLHQVVARDAAGRLTRHADLAEALTRGADADGEEWRVHFHVPLFVAELAPFASTRDFLAEILALHRETPIAPHLEVETYTWDVLPPAHRGGSIDAAIARELDWVLKVLA